MMQNDFELKKVHGIMITVMPAVELLMNLCPVG